MEQGIRIVIIGDSVMMEGIVVSLAENPHFHIEHAGADTTDTLNLIKKFKPQVIIFEFGFPIMETILSLICELAGVRLVAMAEKYDRMIVMDAVLFRSPSLADLQKLTIDPAMSELRADVIGP